MEERPFKRARSEFSTTLHSTPLVAATKAQAAWRGFTVRQEGLAVRRKAAANSLLAARREHESTVVATRLRTPEYRQIARLCKAADPAKLARVDMALERLIGLVPIKEYCASQRRDCLARTALGEPPCVRNVLISGNLGVGKKLAAETLTELLRALGVARGMVSTRTTLEGLVLDVRRDVSCVIIDGLDKIESMRGKVDAVLANYPDHCFIFLGPTDRIEALHGAVSHFRKVEPVWLQLPNYAPAELAEIAQRRLVERGYALADGLGPCELQIALSATWSRDVLAMRTTQEPPRHACAHHDVLTPHRCLRCGTHTSPRSSCSVRSRTATGASRSHGCSRRPSSSRPRTWGCRPTGCSHCWPSGPRWTRRLLA
jgi:hypothetical protein